MNIKDAAIHCGLPAKTIRYYEEAGLVVPARAHNGYRSFSENDLHNLTFVARARSLGFSVEDCRALLGLYQDEWRSSAEVKAIARQHLADISRRIQDLSAMERTLKELVADCAGDARPDCPILRGIGGDGAD